MQIVANTEKQNGVTVVLMHPGAVLTERQACLAEYPGMIENTFSVGQMLETIDGLTLEVSGRFIRYDGEVVPW